MATHDVFNFTMTTVEGQPFYNPNLLFFGLVDYRGGTPPFPWDFMYFTTPGTAKAYLDFVPLNKSGHREGFGLTYLVVETVDDDKPEPDEKFQFKVEVVVSVNIPNVVTPGTITFNYTLIIKDNDKFHCLYDLDGDGKATGAVELTYSEAWAGMDALQSSINDMIAREWPAFDDQLLGIHDQIRTLQGQQIKNALITTTSVFLRASGFVAGLDLKKAEQVGHVVGRIKEVPAALNAAAPLFELNKFAYEAASHPGEVGPKAVSNALFSVFEVATEVAESEIEFLPIVGICFDLVNLADEELKLQGEIIKLRKEGDAVIKDFEKFKKFYDLAKKIRDQTYDCVKHVAPGNLGAAGNFGSNAKQLMFDASASREGSSSVSAPAKVIKPIDISPLHKSPMAAHYYSAVGTNAPEVLHATSANLHGSKSFCVASTGGGNDRIIVSAGAVYVDGEKGTDSIFVYGKSGGLASVDDIVWVQNSSAGIEFIVGDSLFLVARGVEGFTFREGTYHLSGSALKFKAGDLNLGAIKGTAKDDTIVGSVLADKVSGFGGDDKIDAKGGNDSVYGGTGNDIIVGGAGRDTMSGGPGADDFAFVRVSEMGKTAVTRDRITDFKHLVDDIVLSKIDANTKVGGNQTFKWIAGNAFHHVAGELRYEKHNLPGTAKDVTIVEGDVNGDGKVDFQIELKGLVSMSASDFAL